MTSSFSHLASLQISWSAFIALWLGCGFHKRAWWTKSHSWYQQRCLKREPPEAACLTWPSLLPSLSETGTHPHCWQPLVARKKVQKRERSCSSPNTGPVASSWKQVCSPSLFFFYYFLLLLLEVYLRELERVSDVGDVSGSQPVSDCPARQRHRVSINRGFQWAGASEGSTFLYHCYWGSIYFFSRPCLWFLDYHCNLCIWSLAWVPERLPRGSRRITMKVETSQVSLLMALCYKLFPLLFSPTFFPSDKHVCFWHLASQNVQIQVAKLGDGLLWSCIIRYY